MKTSEQINGFFLSNLGLVPNQGQRSALESLADFVHPENPGTCFILTGPAGSGKTSLMRSLIAWFEEIEAGYYLAAPTGRAAQVAAARCRTGAETLHSMLFRVRVEEDPLRVAFVPRTNQPHTDIRYFVVDEASMIPDTPSREGMFVQEVSLLQQLFRFAGQGNPGNKIIFIGDKFQLPPVNCSDSPALTPGYLREHYGCNAGSFSLMTVERTGSDSYVLQNAGRILQSFGSGEEPRNLRYRNAANFSSGIRSFLADFNQNPFHSAVMIALSNGQVNALNTWVRNFRFGYPASAIVPGESMICNNNTEIDEHMLFKGTPFIVRRTWKPEEIGGLNFLNAEIEFDNHENTLITVRTKILLESVTSQDGMIPYENEKALLHEAYRKNRKFRESRRPADDAFVSALRARHGYAMTCHKAQGGEWDHVYLHPGYRKNDLRWLYTAMTRARSNVYTWPEKN